MSATLRKRASLEEVLTHRLEKAFDGAAARWLGATNCLTGAFLAGGVLAPALERAGLSDAAAGMYAAYHAVCHQWAFRSFFLFGGQSTYDRDELMVLGVDPFTTSGTEVLGWKMAFCERDLTIFGAIFLFGLAYAVWGRTGGMRPLGYFPFVLMALPMAVDGLTQLVELRESTVLLRLGTGGLFGIGCGWLLFPRFQDSLVGPVRT